METSEFSLNQQKFALLALFGVATLGAVRLFWLRNRRSDKPAPDQDKVLRIVLTGGPCGGKSTAMKTLVTWAKDAGFEETWVVPEVPTITFQGGMNYPGLDKRVRNELISFETAVLNIQIAMEDAFVQHARHDGKKRMILFDRGACDIKAYLPDEIWQELLTSFHGGIIEHSLFNRYDMVFHLETAARGALKFYQSGAGSNNETRKETPEEAIALDKKCAEAWKGHPNRVLVLNTEGGFKAKLDTIVEAVARFNKK